ncbi:MAG TPA: valine--tRNA ligase [Candidatus Acidoferrales bacterium]|nr:valine--tRNA ligase [Candidatus Acidoferrales bacterium]
MIVHNQAPPVLPETYDPSVVEPRRYALWEAARLFHEEPDPARPPFIVSMPPPNITGRAHLGHGSTYTPQDILTRYHRMLGENADWLPGQDHAAIATEAVVVRELAREGLTRDGLGREEYLARVWAWRHEYGGAINEQFRRLGFGPDWERERFTMDAGLSAAVTKVFVDLYREGLIYRGTRLVNWDPQSQSTLSDAEVESEERDGSLWHVRYDGEDGRFSLEVATTRPETMLGDVAVAVHPDDPRYRDRIGKQVILPLVGRAIPIVADAAVDPTFGTGAVKVTPAHDPTDYEIGQRHALEMPTVIDFDARITAQAPAAYRGLDRFEARRRIVADLESAGHLVAVEPHRHKVPVSSRSGAVVEPLLSLQWFCTMEPLAKPALQAYRDGRVRFVPERFGRTYEQWLENIRDWNVSRQVWWGHQLPVWYTPGDDVIVAHSQAEALEIARTQFGTTEIRRDPDTLDTWFSSGLWPFSILGWPEQTPELAHWYPNSVLITGREIIFLWVARMVMLGLHFIGRVPFHTVFIAPLVFDAQGRKMSKSLGNVIDPMDLAGTYGADAFRFAIVRQMRLESQELRFDERFCDEGRRFNTKMWNALRYASSLPEGLPSALRLPPAQTLTLADRWILTRLHETIERVTTALDQFEFGVVAETLLDFVWYRFCDWYIEATKEPSTTRAAVLSFVLNNAMRLLHPVSPFVTEEIWLALPHDGATIVTASWPDPAEVPADPDAAARFEAVIGVVTRARNLRSELGLSPKERITLEVPAGLDPERRALLARLAGADIVDMPTGMPPADDLAAVSMRAPAGVLRARYERELERLAAEIERLERKLRNEQFVRKASPDVVAKEREKLAGYEGDRARARERLANLAAEGMPNG